MISFKLIGLISGVAAACCLLLLPLWILGVPGVDNPYAKGWNIGLSVLWIYPLSWLLNYVVYFAAQKRLGTASDSRWQTVTGCIALTLLSISVVRLIQSFKLMF